jgi:hypothetical protein
VLNNNQKQPTCARAAAEPPTPTTPRVHRFHILSKLVQQNKTHEIQCVAESSNTTHKRSMMLHISA